MSNDLFDIKVLAEKLSKLNNSQQSIESLSRWCISHRKKARQVVETWDQSFNSAQKDQRVSFLYLANDILQNSRRKGSEFVNEFWKVLPAALKLVLDNGDENGRKTVSRLVNIWEERKVFGSRGQNLKQELLNTDPPPQSTSNGKPINPVKIVKKDAQAIRIKLPVGGVVEKIVTAFHNFHDQGSAEEAAIMRSNEVVFSIESLEKNVENASAHGLHLGPEIVDQLQDQESLLVNCIEQLERAESTRVTLVSQLKEALVDQEKQLEMLRSQLRVTGSRISSLENMRQKLSSQHNYDPSATFSIDPSVDMSRTMEPNKHDHATPHQSNGAQTTLVHLPTSSVHPRALQPPLIEPVTTSFAALGGGTPGVTDEEKKKSVAAAVAAKLAASASSAQMLTSVLSSLVAEEAARSMNKPQEKRQKVENISSSSAGNNTVLSSESGGASNNSYYNPHFMPTTSNVAQSISHPPLPPLQHPGNLPSNQFMPSSGMMMLPVLPFSYGSGNLPPPPPPLSMPSNVTMGMTRQSTQQQASPPPGNQPPQQQPGSGNGGGYYRPTSMGIYGQNQQAMAPPPVNLQ